MLSGCQTSENVNREQDASEENDQQEDASAGQSEDTDAGEDASQEDSGGDYVTEGTEEYRGFTLDNVLHSQTEGDIHYNLYIPDSYDGEEPCAIFLPCPDMRVCIFREWEKISTVRTSVLRLRTMIRI